MLTTEQIRAIRRLQIVTRRQVDEVLSGRYRSMFRGQGMEFEEVREYQPGDEVKSIDWKVTARMGRPYVKRYREERELTVMILLDVSGSMGFGATSESKRAAAAELAAVLAVSAMKNNDKVGLILFSDRVELYVPPKKGSAHAFRIIREMLAFEPEHRGTDPGEAVAFLSKVLRRRSVAFLLSDLLAEGYVQAFQRANRRHELVALAVTDPGDFSLPEAGLLSTVDLETGEEVLIDCFDRRTREEYARQRRGLYDQATGYLKRAGIDMIQVSTGGSATAALEAYFRTRERRFR